MELTKEEALKIIDNDERNKIHCFMGMIGADWDKKSVRENIENADKLGWTDNIFNHNLATLKGGKQYNFDIESSKK